MEVKKCKNACNTYCMTRSFYSMHPEALMEGLNALRLAGKLVDVSLIVDGRTFKAHRAVLAACSDYFSAMFTTEGMRETRQFEIKLEGVNAKGMELVLDYIYAARLDLDRNNVQDVLSASSHVQVKDVVDACSTYLEGEIDLENCATIAALADFYALDSLKKRCYRFMCSRLSEFAGTSDLRSLSLDQMECLLTCNYPVDCTEERVLDLTLQYCVDTNLKPELGAVLLRHVRFEEISTCALKKLTHKWCKNGGDEEQCLMDQNKPNVVVCKLMLAEKIKQEHCFFNERATNFLGIREEIADDVLTNSRGMELTLVKIGGFEPNGLTNEISCYLPSKGKWEVLTSIPHIEQCNYGTAVLGNELYVVGGSYDVCLKEYIHPFGFRYCATKNKWTTMAPIQADRCRFSLNAMGKNFLYAVGGVCEINEHDVSSDFWAHNMIPNCERYNANKDQWEYLPALEENRSQHAGVVLGDKLYISGGIDRHLVLSSLWCFDTKSNSWLKLEPMPTPRADHILISLDGNIYACGGWYEDSATEVRVLADTIDVYDVETNRWSTETTNPMPKFYTGVAAMGRKIYFVGGLLSTATINRATSSVHCYDLETKNWSMNSDWEYPQEVWECTCTTFYVPSERDEPKSPM